MKLTTPKESEIQKGILAFLRAHGAWCVRVNGGAVKTEKRFIRFTDTVGTPDILCCWPMPARSCTHGAVFVAVECKRPGGKLRPEQAATIDAINRAGGVAFVADSIEAVERALKLEGLL